jgi:hypothetical protein
MAGTIISGIRVSNVILSSTASAGKTSLQRPWVGTDSACGHAAGLAPGHEARTRRGAGDLRPAIFQWLRDGRHIASIGGARPARLIQVTAP